MVDFALPYKIARLVLDSPFLYLSIISIFFEVLKNSCFSFCSGLESKASFLLISKFPGPFYMGISKIRTKKQNYESYK